MEKINWGIIGCGDVCEVKSGPAFYKAANSSLRAVMRRDPDKVKEFALKHHVPKYYTDAEQLINDPEVNAVYVATPPDTHKLYAIQAMQAGKPVYVEKPMAITYQDCLEMIKVSKETEQKLFVAYYRRALPYFLKVKSLLEQNIIGKIQTVNTQYYRKPAESDLDSQLHTWRIKKEIAGNGYFYDIAPHTLDILDFLLEEITEVDSYIGNMGNYYDVEDTISIIFRFKSGIQGTGQWNFVSAESTERDFVEISGTSGSIRFNTFAFKPIEVITNAGINYYETEQPQHIQQPFIETIINELRGVGKSPSTGISAARTALVMDKIFTV